MAAAAIKSAAEILRRNPRSAIELPVQSLRMHRIHAHARDVKSLLIPVSMTLRHYFLQR